VYNRFVNFHFIYCTLFATYRKLRWSFFTLARSVEDFEILHGEMHGLSDTVSFLKSLSGLDNATDSGKNSEKRQLRERTAAAALFNWEV